MTMEQAKACVREAVRARIEAATGGRTNQGLPLACLTTAEAAVALNKRPKTLHNWSSEGRGITPLRDANGNLQWPVAAIEGFLMGEQQ